MGVRIATLVAVAAILFAPARTLAEEPGAGATAVAARSGALAGAFAARFATDEAAASSAAVDTSSASGGVATDRADLEDAMFGSSGEPSDATATAANRTDLEDAMFGASDDVAAAAHEGSGGSADTSGTSRDEAMLGGADTYAKQASLMDRLDDAYDKLAIGGMLYSRAAYRHAEGDTLESAGFAAPTLFDAYFDGRPNDRVRAFARGRLTHQATSGSVNPLGVDVPSATAPAQTEVALDQLWLKFDVARRVFVTVGRQPVRWGSGRFWNPSDVLNQQTRDPLAVFDERLGVDLVKAHASFESIDANLYAVANLSGASDLSRVGGALRAEWLVGLTELALTAALRKGDATRLAADISTGLWLFDVRCEVGVVHGERTQRWEGSFEPASLVNPLTMVVPTAVSQEEDWLTRVVAGVETTVGYSDEDTIIFGLEYFFHQAGYHDAELLPWVIFNGGYVPLSYGQHYGALYAMLAAPGSWNDTSFIASAIGNFSDLSFLTRLDARVRVLTYLDVAAWGTLYVGEEGELRPAISIPPVAFIPELVGGLEVAPPRFELGVGATARF